MSRPPVAAEDTSIVTSNSQTIFVSEYVCSGAWPDNNLDSSLATEGRTMLLALLRNLLRPDGGFFRANLQEIGTRGSASPSDHSALRTLHSAFVRTTWDDRLGEFPWPEFNSETRDRLTILPVARTNGGSPEKELDLFRCEIEAADAVFVIAPEFFSILESRTCEVERIAPGRLIGCSSDAVRLCADKLALAEFLPTIGVPTIETHPFDPKWSVSEARTEFLFDPKPKAMAFSDSPETPSPSASGQTTSDELLKRTTERPTADWPFPIVIKPRDGAGSTLTFRVGTDEQLAKVASQLRTSTDGFNFVQQPFIPGLALSGAALISGDSADRTIEVLPTGEQRLTNDGRFEYCGTSFPGSVTPRDHQLAEQIIRRCCKSIPGLRGYVGFDLISASDGVRLVEINPRLTTSLTDR